MRIALKSALMLTTRVIQIINPELHRHMQRTALIALTLAQRLELPDERQQTIFCAALLHDIGVLGDKRTIHSLDAIDNIHDPHQRQGVAMLEGLATFQPIVPFIRDHHFSPNHRGSREQHIDYFADAFERLLPADSHEMCIRDRVMGLFAKLISHYVEKDTLVQQLQAANVALELHSSTDELTQLPNRRALFKQLALRFASARAQQQQVSLIFIDLDGFKAINDRFGHPCGDSFLVQVGKRLTAVARREDIVGRLGGDEFLIVGSAQQPAAQQAYVTSLRQALCGVYFLGEQRIDYEGASFGVVTCDPQSIDVEAALRAADEAMYQDKKSRRQENFIHID